MRVINPIFSQRKYQIVTTILIIAVITLISFSSSLDNGFLNWDDQEFVTENPLIKDLSWENTKAILTSFYKETFHQPLVLLSFSLEYHFFQLSPFIYHLDNLILHILNSLLVFYLILMFSENVSISFVTALLFGIHPLHVESVAWVSERKDLLSTFFFLQAIIYYYLYSKKGVKFYYYISLLVFIFSLLSKAMTVTLPIVLLLCDYLAHRRFDRKTVLEKAPFFVISCIFGVVNLFIHQSAGAISSTRLFSFFDNLLIACKGVVFYMAKTILPINLSAFYPYPKEISIFMPEFFLSIIALLFLTAAVFYSTRYTRKVIFGSLFFLVTILPVLKLIPFGGGGAAMADRYMYIPSIGLFYMVGLAFRKVYSREGIYKNKRSVSVVLFLSVAVLTFSVLTYQRNKVWKDSETLWLNVIENYPDVLLAHFNLGNAYVGKGRIEEAKKEFQIALRLDPNNADIHTNLGSVYYKQNKIGEAIEEYREALRLNPEFAKAHLNLGNAYYKQNKIGEAIEEYKEALRLNPESAMTHNDLGNAYYKQNKIGEAIEEYKEALRLNPESAMTHNNLGNVYYNQNKIEEAIEEYKEALRLNPEYTEALYNLGDAYLKKGLKNEAAREFKEILKIKPDH